MESEIVNVNYLEEKIEKNIEKRKSKKIII